MPRNGSGIYGPPAGTAAVPNTTIESADYNAVVADMSQALTDSVNVHATAPFQANQPMGGNKLTGLGAGAAAADSANLGQVQSEIVAHATAVGGTADAVTATFSPAFAAYAAKMRFRFTAGAANTTAAPTINIDGLGTKIIKKLNGAALALGDIAGSGHVCDCVYNGTDIILLNFAPVAVDREQTFTAKQTFAKPLITTMTTLTDAATIAWDMNAASNDVRIVLTASRNLGLPTNMNTGQKGLLVVQQDGTGGWGLNLNAIFKVPGAFIIEKAANAGTIFSYQVIENHAAVRMIVLSRLWSEGKSSIGFWKEFDLGTFNDNFEVTRAHGLSHHPALVVAAIENISADLGFTPGQRIWNLPPRTEGNSGGIEVWSDSVNVGVAMGTTLIVIDRSNFQGLTATEASWKVVVRIYE
jgi:hypothetical protein